MLNVDDQNLSSYKIKKIKKCWSTFSPFTDVNEERRVLIKYSFLGDSQLDMAYELGYNKIIWWPVALFSIYRFHIQRYWREKLSQWRVYDMTKNYNKELKYIQIIHFWFRLFVFTFVQFYCILLPYLCTTAKRRGVRNRCTPATSNLLS